MNLDELRYQLENILDELSDDEFVEIWNSYASVSDNSTIYLMSEIEEVLMGKMGMNLLSILDAIDDKFYTDDYFFTIDDMDYITSFTDLREVASPVDRDALVEYMIETGDDFGYASISEALGDAGVEYGG